ncbi:MAG: hypothetical protein IBX64_12510, partial [Actinobacteria bacterium]|nr:hypothetical protein [Actinomycetota bacterium]
MANRRMLSKNIHKSKKLARLKTDFARLCWTWIIPFTDDYGRFEADPEVFRATIFPLIKTATEKRIAEALNDLCHVGLIRLYIKVESHGIQRNPNDSTEKTFNFYGEITNFDEFQTFKNDRSRKAEYPKPEQGDYISGIHWNPTTSNWNPNLTKENLNEDNLKE